MDINCDLGEYERLSEAGKDAEIMPYIHACNIACGGHAGNAQTMQHSVQLAQKNGVVIGAHPSYPDPVHFGRRSMALSEPYLYKVLVEQILMLQEICDAQGVALHHVKPHGALYNDAADDLAVARVIVSVVKDVGSNLKLYGQAHSALAEAAQMQSVPFVAEGFVDRRYLSRHRLVPRAHGEALIENLSEQIKQAEYLIKRRGLYGHNGRWLSVHCQTLCLHGDQPGALDTAIALSKLVKQHQNQETQPS